MLRLPEAWVWDFWVVDDGTSYHLFFLYASRALKNPHDRHHRASVGHAVSEDLRTWHRVTDALVRGDRPAFDDLATWTGCVVRGDDGLWYMFYTGAHLTSAGNVQTIGFATSADLYDWDKHPENPVLTADARWYEKLEDGCWADEAFRDPWVMRDAQGNGWHMLITARANHGPVDDRGVVGHAWSPDLRHWQLLEPLSGPGQGFGQLEVMQYAEVEGQGVLLFSCLAWETSAARKATGTTGGVWLARAEHQLGPYDIATARQLTDNRLYVGRLVRERETGRWLFMAFHHHATDGSFIGEITDPEPFSLQV